MPVTNLSATTEQKKGSPAKFSGDPLLYVSSDRQEHRPHSPSIARLAGRNAPLGLERVGQTNLVDTSLRIMRIGIVSGLTWSQRRFFIKCVHY